MHFIVFANLIRQFVAHFTTFTTFTTSLTSLPTLLSFTIEQDRLSPSSSFHFLQTMPTNLTLFAVNAILILSTDDRARILTKYYSAPHGPPNSNSHPGANPYPTIKEQKAFEKGLLEKTNKQTGDVILYDGRVVVYKMEGDVMLYVVGGGDENEILLFSVVLALRDSLAILLKFAFLSNLSLPALY